MKAKLLSTLTCASLYVFTSVSTMAQDTMTPPSAIIQALWPKDKMPGQGAKEPEKELPSRGDNVRRLTNISEPMITVFKVSRANKNAATPAVIICPGGAYGILAYDKEGTEIAAWVNTIGMTAVVLKYRVPNNMEGAFQDIQRAIRLVRHNSSAWSIDPQRVGVMGFSAGGHLSARLSNNYEKSSYQKIDEVDEGKLRPDFAVLVYPAYLSQGGEKLGKDFLVNEKTPPTFVTHVEDDKPFIAGSKLYVAALQAAKVPSEFFLCADGGHGFALRSKKEIKVWPKKCQDWLVRVGILQSNE